MVKNTILVTGGAGFIGSHLCERLLREGHPVICFDNFDAFYDPNIKMRHVEEIRKKFPENFELVTGDIRNEEHLGEVFKKNRVDLVVHLAAKAGVRPSIAEPLVYQDVNVRGTVCLFEACRANDVPQVVFASSSSVYGENQRVPFSEKDLDIQPISPYGATKRAGKPWGTPITTSTAWTWRVFGSSQPTDLDRDRRWPSTNLLGSSIVGKRFPFTVTALPAGTTLTLTT